MTMAIRRFGGRRLARPPPLLDALPLGMSAAPGRTVAAVAAGVDWWRRLDRPPTMAPAAVARDVLSVSAVIWSAEARL